PVRAEGEQEPPEARLARPSHVLDPPFAADNFGASAVPMAVTALAIPTCLPPGCSSLLICSSNSVSLASASFSAGSGFCGFTFPGMFPTWISTQPPQMALVNAAVFSRTAGERNGDLSAA